MFISSWKRMSQLRSTNSLIITDSHAYTSKDKTHNTSVPCLAIYDMSIDKPKLTLP